MRGRAIDVLHGLEFAGIKVDELQWLPAGPVVGNLPLCAGDPVVAFDLGIQAEGKALFVCCRQGVQSGVY